MEMSWFGSKEKEKEKAKAKRNEMLEAARKKREVKRGGGYEKKDAGFDNVSLYDTNQSSWKFWQGQLKPVTEKGDPKKRRERERKKKYFEKRKALGLLKPGEELSSSDEEPDLEAALQWEYVPGPLDRMRYKMRDVGHSLKPTSSGKSCCCWTLICAVLCIIILLVLSAAVFIAKHPELLAL
eukprot:TRINITY_DN308_c0_g1_i1.p1 TRINITY_DN308_c0_g1~~TRINITY_DN308_c0_g1_i1.p1  ORF type:complete len:182 (-),score=43.72 TRINITY_DN308_c0_g1_i1:36-581(-)